MAENVGLGSAIAEGTDLRGNFGNPITQGLQLNQRNVIADAQREQANLAKQQAMMDKIAKYSTFDKTLWEDKKLADEAEKVTKEGTARIMLSMQAGDRIGAEQAKMETQNKLGSLKLLNRDYSTIKKVSDNTANGRRLKNTFAKGGVQAIAQEDEIFFFAPNLRKFEDGSFQPIEYKKVDVNKNLNRVANQALESVIPNAKRVVRDGRSYVSVDPRSPEYGAAKQRAIDNMDEYMQDIIATDEFKDYYVDYLKKNNITPDKVRMESEIDEMGGVLPPDYEIAYEKFMSDKFDKIVSPPLKSTKLSQGKSKASNPYDKSYNKFTYRFFDGETAIIDPSTNITKRTFNGVLANEASGNFEGEKEPILLETPKVKYDTQIKSFVVRGRDEYGDMVRIKVSPEELITTQGIENKEKLAELFPDYKPTKAAGGAGKPKESNKPKDSFPVWKSKNPNGTAAQYKQYKNS